MGSTPPKDVFRAKDVTTNGVIFQDANVKVSTTEVCHYHFDPVAVDGQPHKSLAYRFETADRIIVFSGDTGICAAMIDFSRNADLLVHEVVSLPQIETKIRKLLAGQNVPSSMLGDLMKHMRDDHTTPEDIGKLATAAGVKKVVLTHFTGGDNDPEDVYLAGVKRNFKGPVFAARDLMEY